MLIKTKAFGEVEIDENKMIVFEKGMIGYPELTEFSLIHNEEMGNQGGIRWMQSIQEPSFALPVVNPLDIVTEYNPVVNDELLEPLGLFEEGDMLVLVTVTVPKELNKMSINLKAPLIINAATRKAIQVIVENDDFPIRYPIYEILQARKKGD